MADVRTTISSWAWVDGDIGELADEHNVWTWNNKGRRYALVPRALADDLPDTALPPLVLTGLVPPSIEAGGTGDLVTVSGTGFRPACRVWADEAAQLTTYVNDRTLTYMAQAAAAGSQTITVRDGAAVSNALELAVTAPPVQLPYPLTLPWSAAFWADGPKMRGVGLAEGAPVDVWPDEMAVGRFLTATNGPAGVWRDGAPRAVQMLGPREPTPPRSFFEAPLAAGAQIPIIVVLIATYDAAAEDAPVADQGELDEDGMPKAGWPAPFGLRTAQGESTSAQCLTTSGNEVYGQCPPAPQVIANRAWGAVPHILQFDLLPGVGGLRLTIDGLARAVSTGAPNPATVFTHFDLAGFAAWMNWPGMFHFVGVSQDPAGFDDATRAELVAWANATYGTPLP